MGRRVRFLANATVCDHNGQITHDFQTHQVVELSLESANRWIRRGIAIDALEEPESAPDAAEPEKPKRAPKKDGGPAG